MEIENSSCDCEYDLNYFLLCKKNYVKIIEKINAILGNFENIKILTVAGVCQDDIDFFIEKRNDLNIKLDFCCKKIKQLCHHQYVNDVIDIDPERSQYITYCVICEDIP